MRTKHELAGETVRLQLANADNDPDEINGKDFRVEDWWENVGGQSWMDCKGNPACLKYAMRSGFSDLPTDNEVVYGKVGSFGHLVHVSELPQPAKTEGADDDNS